MLKFTDRELKVLHYLTCGLPYKEVATELGISVSTVKYYAGRMMLAVGVENRSQLGRWAHLYPDVFRGHAVELAVHPPMCKCEHPLCVAMRPAEQAKVA